MDDEKPNHDNGCPTSCLIILKVINVLGEDDSDNQMAKTHAYCTDCKNWLTTQAIDPENSGDGGDEHDNTDDSSGEEGSGGAAHTELAKDGWSVVKNLNS
jgi:hypothetical protein